jgi:selenocysteine-specific elongation factor
VHVVATAGHVDHGKSSLVRALTGEDPDRLVEERRRGLTIDLGFAWTDLPSGERLAFVDVPGHERFLPTMLAGVGPVPAALLVVAADEGWRRQTGEHVAALQALGVAHILVAVTRIDLAAPDEAVRQVRTQLGDVPWVAVSATTGAGLDGLRAALDTLVADLPAPRTARRQRLFIDRSFAVQGAGTVVTATVTEGSLRVGDAFELEGRPVVVRGLECCREPRVTVDAVARVAINLRGISHTTIHRGAALLTAGAWAPSAVIDARLVVPSDPLPSRAVLHIGAAGVPVRLRTLGDAFVRLTLDRPLPLEPGDRAVLRDPGKHAVAGGLVVVEVDPPPLTGRGAARRRAAELSLLDAAAVLHRHGALTRQMLRLKGFDPPEHAVIAGQWVIDPGTWQQWLESARAARNTTMAELAAGLPDPALVSPLLEAAGVSARAARVGSDLPADLVVRWHALESHLGGLNAPLADVLRDLGLDHGSLARLAESGHVLRVGALVLAADAADKAVDLLEQLAQPFTTAEAKAALGVSRRVAIPLLEHLDRTRRTRRDGDVRTVRR